MGPCSPCVCAQMCNDENGCLYVHLHHSNDIDEPVRKKQQYLKDTSRVRVTLFTHIDTPEKKNVFQEGNHAKRIERFIDKLHQDENVSIEKVYYTQSLPEEDAQRGYRDRFVIFNERKPYKVDMKKQKYIKDTLNLQKNFVMSEYTDKMLTHEDGKPMDLSRHDNPLTLISYPNVESIVAECERRVLTKHAQDFISGRPF